jgi:hypothetical protein
MMRIYVDFNTDAMDPQRRVLVNTDVRPELLPRLKAGTQVVIYDETLEVQGRLEFEPDRKRWLVAPNWSTKRHLV